MASTSYYEDDNDYGGYNPLYCDVCDLELNSELVMESHLAGAKHKKKLKAAGLIESDVVQRQLPKPVQPKGMPKFVTLTSKLETAERDDIPVIGVSEIEEIRKRSTMEGFEPKYRCKLCNVSCEVDPMYQHVVGHKHRIKIIERELNIDKDDIWNNWSKEDIKYEARKIWKDEKRERRGRIEIKKIVDDEEFMALVPDTQKVKLENEKPDVKVNGNPLNALLEAIKAGTCRDEDDAKLCYDVSLSFMFKISEFRCKNSIDPEKESDEWDRLMNNFSAIYAESMIKKEEKPRKRKYEYESEDDTYDAPRTRVDYSDLEGIKCEPGTSRSSRDYEYEHRRIRVKNEPGPSSSSDTEDQSVYVKREPTHY